MAPAGFGGSTGGAPGIAGTGAFVNSGGTPFTGAGGILNAGGFLNSGGSPFGGSTFDGSTANGGFQGTGGVLTASGGAVASGGFVSFDASTDGPAKPHPCPSGHYTGTLSGPYTSTLGRSEFVAHLDFTVTADGAVTGTLTGTSDTTSKATLQGKVDCPTGNTTIAIVKGSYRSSIIGTTAYTGTMSGTYDSSTSSFSNGQWTISEPNSSGSGQGTWSAS